MRKILLITAIGLLSLSAFSQTGVGWVQQRVKNNFRDSAYFYKDARFNGTLRIGEGNLHIGAVTITPDGTEINILNGLLSNTTELNRLVGVTANVQTQFDGKAPLANPNFTTAVRLAGDSLLPKTRVVALADDAVETRVATARNLGDYAFLKSEADAPGGAMTYEGVVNYVAANGGTGSGGYKWTEFIVGTTTGAPANADTSLTITNMASDVVELYRGTTGDLHKQWLNRTLTNVKTGYRYNNLGEIVVRPAWATGDRAYIKSVPNSSVFEVVLSGGTSTLPAGMMAYWKLDDAGSTAEDSHSTNDGTIFAGVTTGEIGIINNAFDFNGTSSNVSFGTACRPTEGISISFWFNTADITTGTGQWFIGNAVYSTNWCGYQVSINTSGQIIFVLGTNTATALDKAVGTGLDNGVWHHVVATWDGTNSYIYVDNIKSTATAYSTNIVYVTACTLRMGSNAYADGTFYGGLLDEVGIWNRALTDAEVNTLYGKSPYPFE